MSVSEQVERLVERRKILNERPAVILDLERDMRSSLESEALAAHGAEQTRTSLQPSDLESLRTGEWTEDDRLVSVGRLYSDCLHATPYLTRGFSRRDREAIANVAAAYVSEHSPRLEGKHERLERQVRARAESSREPNGARRVVRYLDLIESNEIERTYGLPLRRAWLDENSRPTEHAWSLMRVAVRHAARSFKVGTSARVELRDNESLAALAEREGDSTEVDTGTPFGALAEARADDLATVLGLPLKAARAIEHDALTARYLGSIPADASEQDRTAGIKLAASLALDAIASRERLSREGLQASVSQGRAILRDTYPHPRELRAALMDGCAALRAMATDRLALALADYADGFGTEAEARAALAEYQSSYSGLSPSRSAIERAYIGHAIKAGVPVSAALERAPLISLWASRLMRAEQARANVNGARRIITTGTARTLNGHRARILRSGGYGKRAARIYPTPRTAAMLTREARRTMVAMAGAEWRASCDA